MIDRNETSHLSPSNSTENQPTLVVHTVGVKNANPWSREYGGHALEAMFTNDAQASPPETKV